MLRILIIAAGLSITLFSAWQIYQQRGGVHLDAIAAATQLEWQDLVPATEPLADALSDIPMNVRFDLGYIGKVEADANSHVISRDGQEYRNAMTMLEKYRADGYDVETLVAAVSGRDQEIGERGEAVNSSLDGELVRLPGYALPLEMADGGVTEFLLVPFVGACIHVPPPPPNQIVLAQLDSAYKVNELYEPVFITGHLSAKPASSRLYLVDGQAQVPMGYSMQVLHVEAME